ncbi:MAG: hypothetical protein V2A56_11635 [bacterium]
MNTHQSGRSAIGTGLTAAVRFAMILGFVLFSVGFVHAEERTLLGKDRYEHNGMGAWRVGAGHLAGKTVILSGYQGQLIINHKFGIGFAGENFEFENPISMTIGGEKYNVTCSTTGLDFELFTSSEKLIHPVYGVMVGGGTVENKRKSDSWTESDIFFVAEPRAGVELNVTRWLRVNGVVTWRFASGVDSELFDNSDLSGWTAMMTMKFGLF